MQSVMKHKFSEIPRAEIPRSSFDRSHGHKTTFDAGQLIPIYCDEALPGDTFNLKMHGFSRLATPINPIMDNMFMDTQFFAVPIRLIWDNWQKFNGEQDNPGDSTDYLVPVLSGSNAILTGSIHDYLGLPLGVAPDDIEINALHHRAYNLIWNEWYRDQNLQLSLPEFKGDGPDLAVSANYNIQRRGKRHDYFTSALPWPQKGDSVAIPLGLSAPIVAAPLSPTFPAGQILNATTGATVNSNTLGTSVLGTLQGQTGAVQAIYDPNGTMVADLTNATAATINQLRQSFQVQKLFERDARGGTRYTEIIRSHFGVTSPDARLQRPEFLGGGSTPINMTPIAQTSSTDATTPQGNLSAFGTASLSGHGFTKSFTEHCVIIGLVSVRADLTYQQGLNRMFSRQSRFDYYWPALSHIGEQTILNKEIYAQGTTVDDEVFGYQERYAEYRYKPSQISGLFRSTVGAGSLDPWHLSQEFTSLPGLNATFIEENPPVDRVIALPSEPHFLLDTYFSLKCARPMPIYGVPGMLDHF